VHELLFGPVLLTSVLAGVVALLAPCCVSVMLPAYLSTVFRRRAGVLGATVIFALGVGSVMVPIGLGASALSAAFQRWHTPIFAAGGVAMVAGGLAVLAGWSPKLPMPGGRSPSGGGIGAVYGLGVFSGIASACCAPVLIGVSVLAGATASFPAALSISGAYVVGMVAPLLIMSLGWERLGTRAVRALQSRRVPLYPGARRRVPVGGLLSGLLLVGMGVLTIVLAITGPDMPTTGWRVTFTAGLQHTTTVVGKQVHWLPGWVVVLILVAAVAGIGYQLRRRAAHPTRTAAAPDPTETAAAPPPATPADTCCTDPSPKLSQAEQVGPYAGVNAGQSIKDTNP
jgi:cytochrome c biogenesis protein CcdA